MRISLIMIAATLTLALAPGVAASSSSVYAPESHQGPWASYVAPAAVCPGANSRAIPTAEQERAMLCLINYARTRHHLRSLQTSSQLMASSRIKAEEILRCQQFSHTACGIPVKKQFFTAGYLRTSSEGWTIGENIAWGTSYLGVPQDIMLAWLNSRCHRANIFTPGWHEQGVALKTGDLNGEAGAAVWASDFGVRGVALPEQESSCP